MAKKKPDITKRPESLTELTKDYMLAYIKANKTEENVKFFKELVEKYKGTKQNNLTKEETTCISDIGAFRKEFAEKFFTELTNNTKKGKTWFDLVDEL